MKLTHVCLAVLFAATVSSSAWAATVSGRITYIDENSREIMIDNNALYSLAPNIDVTTLAVAEAVRLDVSTQNGRDVVTAVRKLS